MHLDAEDESEILIPNWNQGYMNTETFLLRGQEAQLDPLVQGKIAAQDQTLIPESIVNIDMVHQPTIIPLREGASPPIVAAPMNEESNFAKVEVFRTVHVLAVCAAK